MSHNSSPTAQVFGCSTETDEELIVRTGNGDHAAFEVLVRRYQAPALNLAYRFLGDAAEAEEAAQEAFLRAYRNADRFHPSAGFRPWFFRILSNLCRDALKKNKPVYRSEVPESISPLASPPDVLESRQRQQAVARAMRRLPENQRLAVLLSLVEGLSYRDVALSLDVSVKAVESLLVRAKRTLRENLGEYINNPGR